MRISLDGYGSKIWKVSRCRPTVSNETILATKQEFFFTKVTPVKSITDIVLLGFWLILLPWMFISSYITIYFFVKNAFSFECLYFSKYDIRMFLSFSCEIGHPLGMYITRGMEGSHPECVQVRTGGEGYHASCVRKHLHYLFSCFCLMVSCFICSFNLTFIQKGCDRQKWLFFSNKINFCCNEISFFYFKLFFRTKVRQNSFNLNQIESYVYSIF